MPLPTEKKIQKFLGGNLPFPRLYPFWYPIPENENNFMSAPSPGYAYDVKLANCIRNLNPDHHPNLNDVNSKFLYVQVYY